MERVANQAPAGTSSADGDPLLRVSGLRLGVGAEGGFEPVSDASLHAARGEVVGIVGESGSGKSLTLRAIAGLLPEGVELLDGEVWVGGTDVTRATAQQLRVLRGNTVGMIFQEPSLALNPTMRVGAQISEAVRAHCDVGRSQAKRRAIELLAQMGIAEAARRYSLYPHELSGGMRQRVMIAIALAGEPSLLLCDEPTTALDATVTLRVLELLLGLAADLDLGIVLVTHDLGVAARLCDRIVVMYAGRMVEEGPARAVLRRPRHPYTLALLRAVPTRETTIADLEAIPGSPPAPGEALPACPFMPRCSFAEPACAEPVRLVAIGSERMSACRRHELLARMVSPDG